MQETARLKFGILLPTREAIMSGAADPVAAIYGLAERAEELGFHSVWVGDSLTARPRLEALTTLAAVAARTRARAPGNRSFSSRAQTPHSAGPLCGQPGLALRRPG